MGNHLVSVIISAYNRPELLQASLASVLSQTYNEIEVIVQDDSTDDACQCIVAQAADGRVKYTRNVPSLGTSANLRAGYRKSLGRFFCTLNDDDLYAPNYIEVMVDAMETRPDIAIAFCDHFVINERGEVLEPETEQNTRAWRRNTLPEGVVRPAIECAILHKAIPSMFALFRREFIDLEDFPDDVGSGYDYWLSYLGVRDGRGVFYTSRRLTFYRVHSDSQTAGFVDPLKKLYFAQYSQFIDQRLLSDRRLREVHPAVRMRLAESHRAAAFAWLRLSNRTEAAMECERSWSLRPSIGVIVGFILCATPKRLVSAVLNRRRSAALS
jgi:glycosyltransferase involved in cell wall biosynthesis